MDAAIMTESHGSIRAGGVACISNTRHPILVAEQVMHTTPHTLIVGKGADDFADEIGLGGVEKTELVSAGAMEEWAEFKKYGTVVDELFKQGHDTVGAVALDVHGNIAAGTSTGGITYKRAGRIGDSPILGSGLYVDARVGGVSTTGHGESIAKVTLARYVTMLMQTTGISVQRAVEDGLKEMKDRTGGCGGCIAIDVNGETGVAFSTQRMVWACVDGSGKMRSGIDRDSVS